MYLDVYIGEIDDCSWDPTDEEWEIGNAPTRLSPFFTSGRAHFDTVIANIESGLWPGMQLDWGAWAARLNRDRIAEFVDECYPQHEVAALRDSFPELHQDLEDLKRFIAELDPDKEYALVASEL